MAQMIVRDLDEDVRDRLRERAKAHGRSMEAEAREILRAAVMVDAANDASGLGTRIAALFSECGLDSTVPASGLARTARAASFDG